MSLGYMGYAKLDNIFLLTTSSGINRNVSPLISNAVWGGGWYNAAKTNFADSQQHFEGSLNFELQAFPTVWNLFADWLVEERVYSKSFSMSPNGLTEFFYTRDEADYRSGAWCSGASFNVDANSLITVGANVVALVRQEVNSPGNYLSRRIGPGRPTGPLNPTPRNLNPLPGWYAYADIDWPNAPPIWTRNNTSGFVMMNGSINANNNTQIIRGCCYGGARVITPQGILTIRELRDQAGIVLAEYGASQIQGNVAQGVQKTLRIKTRFADTRVSTSHRFRVLRSGSLQFVRAPELQVGDRILGQLGNRNVLSVDRLGDPEYWFALGHLYGDGSFRTRTSGESLQWFVPEHEDSVGDRITAYLDRQGIYWSDDVRYPEERTDLDRTLSGRYIDSTATHFLADLPNSSGVRGSWRQYGVPARLWSAGTIQISQFLSGLFTADGEVSKGVVRLTQKYRQVIKDVQTLLRSLGILSTIKGRTRKTPFGASRVYVLKVVGSRGMRRFRDLIGFGVEAKNQALNGWMESIRGHADRVVGIPDVDLTKAFPRQARLGLHQNRSVAEFVLRSRKEPSFLADSMAVHEYLMNDWYFDEVRSISEWFVSEEVFDPYNSQYGSYVADGLVHHNCTGDPNPVAVLQGQQDIDGSITLWRDGGLIDPYGDASTTSESSFSAVNAKLDLIFGGQDSPLQQRIKIRHIVLTSDAFDIQGPNNPTVRVFSFTGLGDGEYPPMEMVKV